MKFNVETFCDNPNNANTYLIFNEDECIIVDPANDEKVLFKYIDNRKIQGILLTHGHFDHFRKLEKILKLTNVPVYMHKLAYDKINNLDMSYAKMFGSNLIPNIDRNLINFVKDNDIISLGRFKVKCLYTPGHTDCELSYIIDDVMFSGDFLFKDTIGRTDLISGSPIRMQNSLREISKRKTNYKIYPGHGDVTYLEDELKNNYYFKKLV